MATKVISLVDSYYNDGCLMWEAKRYGGLQLVIYSQEAIEAIKAYVRAKALEFWGEEDLEDAEEYNELQEAIASQDGRYKHDLTLCYNSDHVDTRDRQGFAYLGCDVTDDILDLLLEQYGRPCIEASNINCLGFDRRGKGKTNKHWGVWCEEILVDSHGEFIERIQP